MEDRKKGTVCILKKNEDILKVGKKAIQNSTYL